MKNVLLGVTSSIAAYKVYDLIRLYKKSGYNVKTIYTPNAKNFVSPLILETLSENPSFCEQFEPRNNTEHITLADWADVFVIAPATANTISKFSCAIADNLLTSIFLAYASTNKPIVIAPAMNDNMWSNIIFQENLAKLKQFNLLVVEPEIGFLACKKEGKGRLAENKIIYDCSLRALYQNKSNNSVKIVVTVGGTREKIDNVRYISNFSSGKMGFALCDEAFKAGYDVTAISTVASDKPYSVINVESAIDMLNTIESFEYDYLIMASAVADFRVQNISDTKIIKEEINDVFELKLVKNPDIITEISKKKHSNQKTIGFCLADKDVINKAKNKLKDKNLDFIIANEINTALNTDKNKVTIIDKNDRIINIDLDTKENIAKKILEVVCD